MSDDRSSQKTTLPRVSDVLAEITAALDAEYPKPVVLERKYDELFQSESVEVEERYAHLQGLQEHYWHKQIWSYFIMGLMAFMIVFQSVLLALVGLGIWSFAAYAWLLPALLVQNLAQVVGLAVFVVKALFKDVRR